MDIRNLLSSLQEAGMTQAEIALSVGCTQPTISEMMSGKIGTVRPSWKIVHGLVQLAEQKGVSTVGRKKDRRIAKDRRATKSAVP